MHVVRRTSEGRRRNGQVSISRGGLAYVCFRQPDDAFFVLWLAGPIFEKRHYDTWLKKIVPDVDATAAGIGFMHAFVNGVDDYAAAPIHDIRGEWTPLLADNIAFKANRLNRQNLADDDSSGFFVDSSQVDATVRYKNQFDKEIEYHLVIQKSTGRFVERYRETASNVPFLERNGRCAVMTDAP